MPDFTYEAIARTGLRSTGTLSAATEREAATMLDARGLFPVRVTASHTGGPGRGIGGVGRRHVSTMFSQLADLLHSGVPMLRSLEILERQSSNKRLAAVVRDVRMKVA